MVRLDLLVLLSPKARLVKCYRSDLGDITLVESFGSGIYMFLDSTATKELAFLNFVTSKILRIYLNKVILYQQRQRRYVVPVPVGLGELHFAQR